MKPDEEGVRMYRFDGQTADVDYPCGLRGISNPAFLTSDSTGNRIYAIGDDEGKSSTANALLFDKESGLLSLQIIRVAASRYSHRIRKESCNVIQK